ncbi:hypothetical protein NB723_003864 [Xanthomonas sacchari]|nr:hypothetical protein [Xanthomonas sacchari]
MAWPDCRVPALARVPAVVRASAPFAARLPPWALAMPVAATLRSRPASTCAALVSWVPAASATSRPAWATPATARVPSLRKARSVAASSVPRLSRLPPCRVMAPAVLCSTAALPVATLAPCSCRSPVVRAWPSMRSARCACSVALVALCNPPATPTSRPLRAIARALATPSRRRSPSAVAFNACAAITLPPSCRSPWLVSVTWPFWLPSWPLLLRLPTSTSRSPPAITLPRLSIAPLLRNVSAWPVDSVPLCCRLPACSVSVCSPRSRPALSSKPSTCRSSPRPAASVPAARLTALAACTCRSRPATTRALLSNAPAAVSSTSLPPWAMPARRNASWLCRVRSVPASSAPWLSMLPPSTAMAAVLCSTAALPVPTLAPRSCTLPPASACPSSCSARCACACRVDALCTVPAMLRSRPASSCTDCALLVPACSRSPAACRCSAVPAIWVPVTCRSPALTTPSCPSWLPS